MTRPRWPVEVVAAVGVMSLRRSPVGDIERAELGLHGRTVMAGVRHRLDASQRHRPQLPPSMATWTIRFRLTVRPASGPDECWPVGRSMSVDDAGAGVYE